MTAEEQLICFFILVGGVFAQDATSLANFSGVCYNELGCFTQDSPWFTPLRPFPIPLSPQEIQVTVYLMTRDDFNLIAIDPLDFDANLEILSNFNFNPARFATAFIIHGFAASIASKWMIEMASAYLSRIDANVFLVDWGGGARNANYLQVAANTRVVGVIMEKFLNYLIKYTELKPYNVHIIGHSLGAHIAGYIGKGVPGLYRITALDPAQIGFEGTDEEVRLVQGDAYFIDVYHTNGKPTVPTFGLGFVSTVGDVDFYINGGFHQPSCGADSLQIFRKYPTPLSLAQLPVEVISELISCSHSKSVEYYIEAIANTQCTMWGRKRGLLSSFLNIVTFGQLPILRNGSQCSLDTCSPMGLETFLYPARGKFFVTTNLRPSYCIDDSNTSEIMKNLLTQYNQ